jgi:hypothetical protein
MKRHPALIPLSRDHHDGLVQALRLRRAAAGGDALARLAAAREFVEFFRNEERLLKGVKTPVRLGIRVLTPFTGGWSGVVVDADDLELAAGTDRIVSPGSGSF